MDFCTLMINFIYIFKNIIILCEKSYILCEICDIFYIL